MNPSSPLWLRIFAWFAVVVWATTITVLSSMTPAQLMKIAPFEWWDKAEHFLAFAAGAAALALALRWSTAWSWRKIVLVTVGAISLFGAIDEFHQLYTPYRSGADPYDWSADTLGAAAGALATFLIHARFTRPPRLASERA